jgi:hypothetical protein
MNEWKIGFKTYDRLYKYMMKLFGQSNTPSTFIQFYVPYVETIHRKIWYGVFWWHLDLQPILEVIPGAPMSYIWDFKVRTLLVNYKKCLFCTNTSIFLDFVVFIDGVQAYQIKMIVIMIGLIPNIVNDMRCFMGWPFSISNLFIILAFWLYLSLNISNYVLFSG